MSKENAETLVPGVCCAGHMVADERELSECTVCRERPCMVHDCNCEVNEDGEWEIYIDEDES